MAKITQSFRERVLGESKGSAAVRVCPLSARTTLDLSACHTVGEEATEIDLSWAPTRTPWQRES